MIGTIYSILFTQPITNVLVVFYRFFLSLHIPGAFGWAIIALTVLIRLILQPFFHKQLETAHKMQQLKPHLDRLHQKHGKDRVRLQQEQMKLYQEAGINPAQGCLLMIIQIPVFIALYHTLSLFLSAGTAKAISQINKVLYSQALHITTIDPYFLGFNLVLSPAKAHIWYYYLVPLVTGFLQYLQASTMTPPQAPALQEAKDKDTKTQGSTADDFQKAMNTQMKYLFPVLIAWFAYSLPVGLSLYWNIFSIFSIFQQKNIRRKLSAVEVKS